MKYFTVEMAIVDGSCACAVYERSDMKTALSAHHSVLASAMANPNCTEVLSMVIDSDGSVYRDEHWKANEG